MNLPIAHTVARACVVLAFLACLPGAYAQNTFVRITTTQGSIDIKLLDTEAPATVANFVGYIQRGDYMNGIIHRSAWAGSVESATGIQFPGGVWSGGVPFVIQAGGYKWPLVPPDSAITAIATQPPVVNESSPSRSNTRGTVAMARGSDPNSATSQWFVNMNNNSFLDGQGDGYAVFGRVTQPGMVVADRISNLTRVDFGSPLDSMPVQFWASGPVYRGSVIFVDEAYVLASATDSDRIFNFLEAAYSRYAVPQHGIPGQALGYYFRWYSSSNAYVGTKDGLVWYMLGTDPNPTALGTIAEVLAAAQAAGY